MPLGLPLCLAALHSDRTQSKRFPLLEWLPIQNSFSADAAMFQFARMVLMLPG
jgi:hypothetical protein